jgi:anti-sigma regulatory factor (Ser/Thr protein kinase)
VVETGGFDTAPEDGSQGPIVGEGEADGHRWASLTLDPSPRSVPAARAWARDLAETWDLGDLDWTLLQLVTELVANSVLHARTRSVVRLEQEIGTAAVRCAVTDFSPVRLRRRAHTSQATTGRGLQMLERLSSSWGVESSTTGKTVWFELRDDAGGDLDEEYWEALADLDPNRPPIDPPTQSHAVLEVASRRWMSSPGSPAAVRRGIAA